MKTSERFKEYAKQGLIGVIIIAMCGVAYIVMLVILGEKFLFIDLLFTAMIFGISLYLLVDYFRDKKSQRELEKEEEKEERERQRQRLVAANKQ